MLLARLVKPESTRVGLEPPCELDEPLKLDKLLEVDDVAELDEDEDEALDVSLRDAELELLPGSELVGVLKLERLERFTPPPLEPPHAVIKNGRATNKQNILE